MRAELTVAREAVSAVLVQERIAEVTDDAGRRLVERFNSALVVTGNAAPRILLGAPTGCHRGVT